jgi:hypothetical protein
LIGNHPLDRSQSKREKCVATALQRRPYGLRTDELAESHHRRFPVVSERRFLEWIGKAVPDSWNRTYSADQIAALSKLSHGTLEELVRFGLLDPRGGLVGFRDLASARQVSSLFANGIGLSEIIAA